MCQTMCVCIWLVVSPYIFCGAAHVGIQSTLLSHTHRSKLGMMHAHLTAVRFICLFVCSFVCLFVCLSDCVFTFSCKVVADDLMRKQLNTMDEERVVAFESDPCAMEERYAAVLHNGAHYFRYTKKKQQGGPWVMQEHCMVKHVYFVADGPNVLATAVVKISEILLRNIHLPESSKMFCVVQGFYLPRVGKLCRTWNRGVDVFSAPPLHTKRRWWCDSKWPQVPGLHFSGPCQMNGTRSYWGVFPRNSTRTPRSTNLDWTIQRGCISSYLVV